MSKQKQSNQIHIVLGLGCSGVSAAKLLKAEGKNVLVLENNSWWEEKPDLVEKELFNWCNGEYFNQVYDPYGLESVTDNDYDENGNWRHE